MYLNSNKPGSAPPGLVRGGTADVVPHNIRRAIDTLMTNCLQRYEGFSDFLPALLAAQEETSDSFYARLRQSGHEELIVLTQIILKKQSNPSYHYIETLLQHNLLHLNLYDPSQRATLFAMAGLIEVTPESIQHFNKEICDDVAQKIAISQPPSWNATMERMVKFHTQGGRLNYETVVSDLRARAADSLPQKADKRYLVNVLNYGRTVSDSFRNNLYDYLQLTEPQREILERLPREKQPRWGNVEPVAPNPMTAHEIIDAASKAKIKPRSYALLLSVLKASDVQVNRYFYDTSDECNLQSRRVPKPFPEKPINEIQPFYFERTEETALATTNRLLDFIDAVLTFRGKSPLSSDDRAQVIDIVRQNVPEKPVNRKSAVPWRHRLEPILPDPNHSALIPGRQDSPPHR